jgi:hypothetical protein
VGQALTAHMADTHGAHRYLDFSLLIAIAINYMETRRQQLGTCNPEERFPPWCMVSARAESPMGFCISRRTGCL